MDFCALPDHVVLEIFRYLPLVDRVRLGRVNCTFRRMSEMAISQFTKTLDLSYCNFRMNRFPPQSMIVLLNLCADRLEEIRFGDGFTRYHELLLLLEAFGQQQFHYPNLTRLRCNVGDAAILKPILSNCPKLSTLYVNDKITFPAEIATNEILESLIFQSDEDGLRSLIGRVPNLKHLNLNEGGDRSIGSAATLDRFLSTIPNLETLEIDVLDDVVAEDLEHDGRVVSHWRLSRLRVLKAYGVFMDDNTSKKVAESFPEMRVLIAFVRDSFTSGGLTWLSSLRELRELELYFDFGEAMDLSTGVLSLVKCDELKELRFSRSKVQLSPSVISQLFHSCRRLYLLELWDLAFDPEQVTDQAAVLPIVLFFVRSLAGLGTRRIRIVFRNGEEWIRDIWRSKAVEEALEKLKREEGAVVEIHWYQFHGDDDDEDSLSD